MADDYVGAFKSFQPGIYWDLIPSKAVGSIALTPGCTAFVYASPHLQGTSGTKIFKSDNTLLYGSLSWNDKASSMAISCGTVSTHFHLHPTCTNAWHGRHRYAQTQRWFAVVSTNHAHPLPLFLYRVRSPSTTMSTSVERR